DYRLLNIELVESVAGPFVADERRTSPRATAAHEALRHFERARGSDRNVPPDESRSNTFDSRRKGTAMQNRMVEQNIQLRAIVRCTICPCPCRSELDVGSSAALEPFFDFIAKLVDGRKLQGQ